MIRNIRKMRIKSKRNVGVFGTNNSKIRYLLKPKLANSSSKGCLRKDR